MSRQPLASGQRPAYACAESGNDNSKLSVGLFSSGQPGFEILHAFFHDEIVAPLVDVILVCRDDPRNDFVHADRRDWQFFDDDEQLPLLVERLAAKRGVPTHSLCLADGAFQLKYLTQVHPALIIACFFGQRVPQAFCESAQFALNLHPTSPDLEWPSRYAGPSPIKRLIADGYTSFPWVAHWMTQDLDQGPLCAWSSPIEIEPDDSHDAIFWSTGRHIATFVMALTTVLLGICTPKDAAPVANFEHDTLDDILASNPNRCADGSSLTTTLRGA